MKKMTSNTDRIGRKTYVDMPAYGIAHVAAKVDTGADSSAIWASDIREQHGVLSFVLFDPSSRYYTGKVVSVDDFEQVSVKNSFGKTEYRYKVRLSTHIEGRKIRVAYTLANRSGNKYPILIGRNTLSGKFHVDVSAKSSPEETRRILLLSAKYSENVAQMIRNIEQNAEGGLKVDYAIYDDVVIRFRDGNMSVRVESYDRDLSDYALVHFKTSVARDLTAALARYAKSRGVRLVDDAVRFFPDMSKLYQYAVLATERLKVPDSLFMLPERAARSYDEYARVLGVPFVIKGIHASRGEVNSVVRSRSDFEKVTQDAVRDDVYLVGQRFVHNTGDYRVLVFGKRIMLVIHRVRKDDSTHLNNTSAGGTASLVEINSLPYQVRLDSLKAADVLGRGIAGVDVIYDEIEHTWTFLEVNEGPQLATGAFLPEKHQQLAMYFLREVSK